MQYANIMLALGGDRGTTVPKAEVSASEIAVLRLIHGDDSIFDVEPVAVDEVKNRRTSREEIRRLTEIYGRARIPSADGTDVSVINALFPGAAAQAIKSIGDLDIPEEFFKAKTRVTPNGGESDAEDEFAKKTKAELLDEAEKRGIEVPATASKAKIIEALRADGNSSEDEVFA